MNCPRCDVPLNRLSEKGGLIWSCPQCRGASTLISRMRKFIPRDAVNALWLKAKAPSQQTLVCPSCLHKMSEIVVPDDLFAVDICTCCAFVWFDCGEYEQLPKLDLNVDRDPVLSPELACLMAQQEMVSLSENYQHDSSMPDSIWKYLPALVGLPVEMERETISAVPYVTWGLGLLIAVVSLAGFAGWISPQEFGLVPAHYGQLAGMTLFTYFFLHGGFFHLLSNLYFLFLFGDDVEGELGRAQFLILLAVSTLVGGLVYVMAHEGSAVPLIGASGGISGVLAYYALRFPRRRIGFFLPWYIFIQGFSGRSATGWLRFPVVAYLGFWIVMQLIGLAVGLGSVAYEAHLGGLMTGAVYWLAEWRGMHRGVRAK